LRIAIDARMAVPRPTGIGRVAVNLIENLARLDSSHEYMAISREGNLPQLSDLRNVTNVRAPFGHLSPRVHTHLPGIIKRSGAELVHFLYFFTPLYSPVPSVVTVFDTTYSRFPHLIPRRRRLLYKFCMKQCMGRARLVICPSESTSAELCRFFPGTPKSKVRVIYLGVEDRFQPPPTPDLHEIRASLGLPEQYIAYVGNHRGHKNLRRLIEAFSHAAKHVPHSLVLPRAEGPGSEITLGAAAECGAAGRILFHPMPDEHLPLVYGLADAFLFPSLSEGFGLPPLEAMACGTPVITSNASSLPEVVGDAGIMVDPHDVEALAEAILRVLRGPDLRREMQAKGLAQAKKFSWQETARQTLNVYESVYNEVRR